MIELGCQAVFWLYMALGCLILVKLVLEVFFSVVDRVLDVGLLIDALRETDRSGRSIWSDRERRWLRWRGK